MKPSAIFAALMCFAVPAVSHAFGTINGQGQHAEHEKITRLALKSSGIAPQTLTLFAGNAFSFGAVGAADNPSRHLDQVARAHCHESVDTSPSQSASGQALLSCRAWIFSNLELAITGAATLADEAGTLDDRQLPDAWNSCSFVGTSSRAKCRVLEHLGLAFHASQDFYAHSNWTDVGGAGSMTDPQGLAQTGPAAFLDPRQQTPTLVSDLRVGCSEPGNPWLVCTDTRGMTRTKLAFLSKETGYMDVPTGKIGLGTTDRGLENNNFARAAQAAIEDTRDKWAYFETRIKATYPGPRGEAILCAIKSDRASDCK